MVPEEVPRPVYPGPALCALGSAGAAGGLSPLLLLGSTLGDGVAVRSREEVDWLEAIVSFVVRRVC